MDKNLHTIQVLAKVGRIVARIIWIAGIVGTVLMLCGIVSLACGLDGFVKVGDVTIRGLVTTETGLSTKQTYIVLTAGAIMLVGNAIMAWFADRYFTMQLKTGTPFTLACANGMRKLGLIYIIGAVITNCLAGFAVFIMQAAMGTSVLLNVEGGSALIAGIMFLVFSVVFRYGAEKINPTDNQTIPTTATETKDPQK